MQEAIVKSKNQNSVVEFEQAIWKDTKIGDATYFTIVIDREGYYNLVYFYIEYSNNDTWFANVNLKLVKEFVGKSIELFNKKKAETSRISLSNWG